MTPRPIDILKADAASLRAWATKARAHAARIIANAEAVERIAQRREERQAADDMSRDPSLMPAV